MVTQNGFVPVKIYGEYSDTVTIPIAYSDNLKELKEFVTSTKKEIYGKAEKFLELENEAKELIQKLNDQFQNVLSESEKKLILKNKIPKPEKWPPSTKEEQFVWIQIKQTNEQIDSENRRIILDNKKNEISNFAQKNPIPVHLIEMIKIEEHYDPIYSISQKPFCPQYVITDLLTRKIVYDV